MHGAKERGARTKLGPPRAVERTLRNTSLTDSPVPTMAKNLFNSRNLHFTLRPFLTDLWGEGSARGGERVTHLLTFFGFKQQPGSMTAHLPGHTPALWLFQPYKPPNMTFCQSWQAAHTRPGGWIGARIQMAPKHSTAHAAGQVAGAEGFHPSTSQPVRMPTALGTAAAAGDCGAPEPGGRARRPSSGEEQPKAQPQRLLALLPTNKTISSVHKQNVCCLRQGPSKRRSASSLI